MFSVINTILLRPLPYADPNRLAVVWTADPARNIHEGATSFQTLSDWRRENHQFLLIWRSGVSMPATSPAAASPNASGVR